MCWTPAMPKTRQDCCRTVSACVNFPWKTRDLGIPTIFLASCHQTLTSLTKFFVSLFLLVQASHFFFPVTQTSEQGLLENFP